MSLLRVAVPNKGSLSESALGLLADAGYALPRAGDRELNCFDPDNGIEFFFQRPRDIAVYVSSGTLDLGITGRDLLEDADVAADTVMDLGFARSRFFFAARPGGPTTPAELHGLSVATSYPKLVAKHLAQVGVSATIVELQGAVENAVALGLADAIADVVETGTSLDNAGLIAFGQPLLLSEAVLIKSSTKSFNDDATEAIRVMVERLQGVLTARRYVMVDYDCPRTALVQACALTPGIESPTVSPLADDGWVAVRALVARTGLNLTMDKLKALGAVAILATELAACRL
ncbi:MULTISPECIES: ATP phosphoribosyltransferase [unclassified Mycobacterium]|uniref:ATP phosphoribosyltransferase n=1 Tax=unclassified Mycobacterium TaxID=2642494 RepID=UPI00048D99CF|nr:MULTISPECIES: ATP phosphoribosyltransferase [unclassified Mycobacterium]SEA03651.1 ATP phosphoribosyltransferase (homohexameric) [Mycobacterium sp. 283mftsu]